MIEHKTVWGVLRVVKGAVYSQDVDIIVNAANEAMQGGGGVDGAIHEAAGPTLMKELRKVAPAGAQTSQIVVTGAHRLQQKYIFHVAGPRWKEGEEAVMDAQLLSCYANAIYVAAALGMKTIAFPAISTGIFGFPPDRAAALVTNHLVNSKTLALLLLEVDEVTIALFGDSEYEMWATALGHAMSLPPHT